MKRIMFNDKFNLTQAVLDGRKTMTRRLINPQPIDVVHSEWGVDDENRIFVTFEQGDKFMPDLRDIYPQYQLDEVVAVAQRGEEIYRQLQERFGATSDAALGFMEMWQDRPMWTNKMFTGAELCPNQIRITEIKVERLQDISYDDCIREGVYSTIFATVTPRAAFAALIDKVSGKGTWEKNPWVFTYSFELVQ